MSPEATGRIDRTGDTADVVITRRFRAPIDDVWASVTDPERTARWFGPWRGEPGAGRTVEVQMAFEEGAPWSPLAIEACEPPALLVVRMGGDWHMELRLTEADGVTDLTLVHHLTDPAVAGSVGPGWEYYLDMLVAARLGTPRPDFDDYYPAQQGHYEA